MTIQEAINLMYEQKLYVYVVGDGVTQYSRAYGFPNYVFEPQMLSADQLESEAKMVYWEAVGMIKDCRKDVYAEVAAEIFQGELIHDSVVVKLPPGMEIDLKAAEAIREKYFEAFPVYKQLDGYGGMPPGGLPIHEIPEEDEDEEKTEEMEYAWAGLDGDPFIFPDDEKKCDCGGEKHGWTHAHWCSVNKKS